MEMHQISRKQVDHLLALLPRAGRDYDLRCFDRELFHLFVGGETAVRQVVIASMLDEKQRLQADLPLVAGPLIHLVREEVVAVRHGLLLEEVPLGPMSFAYYGYINEEGEFVRKPEYMPLPRYSEIAEDAEAFKSSVLSRSLRLQVEQVDVPPEGDWELMSMARLLDQSGICISEHVDISWAMAIVGVTLKALITVPHIIAFDVEIVD